MLKSRIRSGSVAGSAVLFSVLGLLPCACASPLPVFTLYNSDADGSVVTPSGLYPGDSTSFDLIGGNNGSGLPGETDYAGMSSVAGTVQFQWSYTSCFPPNTGSSACDDPGYDWTGYFVGTTFTVADQTQLTDTDTGGVTVSLSFAVPANTQFGWYVGTLDNLG